MNQIVRTKEKTNNGGPDIQIKLDNDKYLWVECTIATKGNNPNDEFYDNKNFYGDVEEYNKSKIIRLCSSIKEKYKKLDSYYKNKIIYKNDLYLIAVNSDFGTDTFEFDNLEKVLYGKGNMVIELDVENKTRQSYFKQTLKVNKTNKEGKSTELDNGIFLNENYTCLTGVLYSGFPNINSIGRTCFSVGFNKNFSQIQNEVEKYFCGYSFLEDQQLKRKIGQNNNIL